MKLKTVSCIAEVELIKSVLELKTIGHMAEVKLKKITNSTLFAFFYF